MRSLFSRLFAKKKNTKSAVPERIFFSNTLGGKKELFTPLKAGVVTMYSCGPTVYGQIHIGNLRAYLFSDLIARLLSFSGYRVRRVMNITDVGHMVGDGDQGEDKMALGAAREKKTPEEIAERYTKLFLDDLVDLNVDTEAIIFPRATAYIKEQIALAKTLEEKGFGYALKDGLYFDAGKFPGYGKLGGLASAEREAGARVSLAEGKHGPYDFVLWRAAKKNDLQQWDSPWGRGNPGWHIECSAMSRALLGIEIDIHTGGEDLAQIHHNNEIAQSEAASGRPFVHYWLHNAFLTIQGEKISKSIGNVVYLADIAAKGLHPLSLRYFFLQAHYRTPLSFSWDALAAANGALTRLWHIASELAEETGRVAAPSEVRKRFVAALQDDLGTPQALSVLWESLKNDTLSPEEKWGLIEDADQLLGLMLLNPPVTTKPLSSKEIPNDIQELLKKREAARNAKDFKTSDQLRTEIENSGYRVEDSPEGPVLTREAR